MKDLIVFAEDLGGLPSSTQHLVRHLARDRKVLWVNSIGLRQPQLSLRDGKRVINKLTSLLRPKRTDDKPYNHDNIIETNLLTIPAPSSNYSRKVARDLMIHQLLPQIEKAGLTKPILWSSLPTAADLCGHLDEHAVVYYCGDDFSALEGVNHKTASQHESKLVDKADLILAASETLKNRFPSSKTCLLRHGVDFDLFASPTKRALDLPTTEHTSDHVVGFYGSLSSWLDYDLIEAVAKQLPSWKFVFIGPNMMDHNPLPNLSNIIYLGPKPHHELPSYSQHWDISMMPFKTNAQIKACNPLKLMEYLASGRPVVSTRFPALNPYKSCIFSATHQEDFTRQLILATQSQTEDSSEMVRNQSWENKSQFISWLMELL